MSSSWSRKGCVGSASEGAGEEAVRSFGDAEDGMSWVVDPVGLDAPGARLPAKASPGEVRCISVEADGMGSSKDAPQPVHAFADKRWNVSHRPHTRPSRRLIGRQSTKVGGAEGQ
jgi:hypothetical protein